MIQRIQTVYLLFISILSVVALSTSVGRFVSEGVQVAELYNLWLTTADGSRDFTAWALFGLLLLVAVLSFLTIFLFRRRMLQIRIIVFCGLLLVGYYIALGAFVWMLQQRLGGSFAVSWTTALPAVALILDYLAFRAVMSDEMMIRSLDRLR